jgi:hypothetical protein
MIPVGFEVTHLKDVPAGHLIQFPGQRSAADYFAIVLAAESERDEGQTDLLVLGPFTDNIPAPVLLPVFRDNNRAVVDFGTKFQFDLNQRPPEFGIRGVCNETGAIWMTRNGLVMRTEFLEPSPRGIGSRVVNLEQARYDREPDRNTIVSYQQWKLHLYTTVEGHTDRRQVAEWSAQNV